MIPQTDEGVRQITPDQLKELLARYDDWRQVRRRYERLTYGSPAFEATASELARFFGDVDFSRVGTRQELIENPEWVLDPTPQQHPQRYDAGGGVHVSRIYHSMYADPDSHYASEAAQRAADAEHAAGSDVVVWIGPPSLLPKGCVTMDDQHAAIDEAKRRKPIERAERLAAQGQFPDDDGSEISNGDPTWTPTGIDEKEPPATMRQILGVLSERFAGWPRMVAGTLFVANGPKVDYLQDVDSFFGWLSNFGTVSWSTGKGFVTQRQLFAEWKRQARSYAAIEPLPHEPPLHQHFYPGEPIQPGDGQRLERLLDFFRPATTDDRDLMRAAFATPLWGGPPGARPAFLLTAPGGRGKGKSSFVHAVARLLGGSIDLENGEDLDAIKKRLLSNEGLTRRLILLDNIKSMRFSWEELEGLITSSQISGHKLYHGEASRPNVLTAFMTVNGASLSKDMAQRVIEIRLAEPDRAGDWSDRLNEFIDTNRIALIGDLLGVLKRRPRAVSNHMRWAAWTDGVLAKCTKQPQDMVRLILARQSETDVEDEEASAILEFFSEKISRLYWESEPFSVFLPSRLAAEWMAEALGEKLTVTAASRRLRQMIQEGTLPTVKICNSRTYGRGFFFGDAEEKKYDVEDRIANTR